MAPNKTGIFRNCKQCNKEMWVVKSRISKNLFCSTVCHNSYRSNQNYVNCKNCNKQFRVKDSKIKINKNHYCSTECHYEFKKSNKNILDDRRSRAKLNRAKFGANRSSKIRLIAFSAKPKQCEVCGYNDHDFCLDIHHKDKNALNNDVNNLAVLCCICHRKLHKNFLSLKDIKDSIILDAQEIIK